MTAPLKMPKKARKITVSLRRLFTQSCSSYFLVIVCHSYEYGFETVVALFLWLLKGAITL